MKNKILVIVLLCAILLMSGCKPKSPSGGEVPEPAKSNKYVVQMLNAFELADSTLWIKEGANKGRLADNSRGTNVATLWTYGTYFTAAAQMVKTYKTQQTIAIARKALAELEWYKCKGKDAYASDNGKERPVFYDDNVWIVLGLLDMYQAFGEEALLEEAIKVQNFIYGGWQADLGGGLLWREFDPQTTKDEDYVRNACINAPAAMTAAILYKVTQDVTHLDWSKRIFDWTVATLKNQPLGTYYDSINRAGKVDYAQFSYNSGCMISAAALLYDITGEAKYLTEMESTLQGSTDFFAYSHISGNDYGDFYYDNPWFRVYLFRGYLDAYNLAGAQYSDYIARTIKGYDFAVSRKYYDKLGFIYDYWDGSTKPNDSSGNYFAEGRHIMGNIESLIMFSAYTLSIDEN